jgi:hypothetical protein
MTEIEWVHYSIDPISEFKETEQSSEATVKPRGLYCSLGLRWLWCAYDRKDLDPEEIDLYNSYTVTPNPDAQILYIDPVSMPALERYRVQHPGMLWHINWSRVAEDYDGVYVDVDGLRKTQWRYFAATFDVPTLCMWRKATIH